MPRSYVSRSAMFDREYLTLERSSASSWCAARPRPNTVATAWRGGELCHPRPSDFLKAADGSSKGMGGRIATAWSEEDHSTSVAVLRRASRCNGCSPPRAARGHAMQTMGTDGAANSNRTKGRPLGYQRPGRAGQAGVETQWPATPYLYRGTFAQKAGCRFALQPHRHPR